MPSELSDYTVNALLNWIRGTAMPAAPAGVYVALHNGDCGVNGTGGTDVTATINAAGRVAITFGAVASREIANNAVADFGDADAGATINSVSFWTAQSGGSCIGYTPLAAPLVVTTGLPVKVPIGNAKFGLPVA
jgi:hypothetical protein